MKQKASPETYLLAALLIILSIGAIYGGMSLIDDSSGENLNLQLAEYVDFPFKDFLIPGVMLLILFGFIPLLLIYPLFTKPKYSWANIFNIYKRRHWVWIYPVYLGIILVCWVNFQILMIGYNSYVQIIYSFYGLSLIAVSLLPKHMRFYARPHSHHSGKTQEEENNE